MPRVGIYCPFRANHFTSKEIIPMTLKGSYILAWGNAPGNINRNKRALKGRNIKVYI